MSETAARSGKRKAEKYVWDLAISWNGDGRSVMGGEGSGNSGYSDCDYFES